ncbi:MAG: MFS transporter [Saprospiraceae bacterium]|nr:MAG: MFS transporter [Saprospiraceae bacterium]
MFADLSSQMIYPLLPQFLVQLGTSTTLIGLIEGIAEATASLFRTVFGRMSDKLGRRKFFIYRGYALSALAKPFLYLATGWIMVLLVKFAERMGKAMRTPARDALLSTSVNPNRRGRDFGIQRSMDKIGSIGGPLLAMLVLYYSPENLRLVFLLAVIPGLLALLFIPFVVENLEATKQDKDLPTPHFLRNRSFNIFLVANILFTLGNSSNAFLLLKATEEGVPTVFLPLLWMGYNFICTLAAPIFGHWSDKIGRRPVILISFFYYALIYVGFAYAQLPIFIWLLFAAYGIYYGLSVGVFKAYLTDLTPPEQRGTAYGIFDTGTGLALLPASILMGFLWENYGSTTAFLTGAGFAILGLVVFGVGSWIDQELKKSWEPPW